MMLYVEPRAYGPLEVKVLFQSNLWLFPDSDRVKNIINLLQIRMRKKLAQYDMKISFKNQYDIHVHNGSQAGISKLAEEADILIELCGETHENYWVDKNCASLRKNMAISAKKSAKLSDTQVMAIVLESDTDSNYWDSYLRGMGSKRISLKEGVTDDVYLSVEQLVLLALNKLKEKNPNNPYSSFIKV